MYLGKTEEMDGNTLSPVDNILPSAQFHGHHITMACWSMVSVFTERPVFLSTPGSQDIPERDGGHTLSYRCQVTPLKLIVFGGGGRDLTENSMS